jgi:spore coat polysaccharide biosynthesis protein SpsF
LKPGIITQARMGSTRLPGKVLKQIRDKPLLEYHLDRLQKTELSTIVATSKLSRDDQIVKVCKNLDVPVYRGDEMDVLSRFSETAKQHDINPIIRVTSDCPLIDPEILLEGLTDYRNHEYDYLESNSSNTLPIGMDFQIISHEALATADNRAESKEDREHVVPWIDASNIFKTGNFELTVNHRDVRITVDYPGDFLLIQELIEQYEAHRKEFQRIVEHYEQLRNGLG